MQRIIRSALAAANPMTQRNTLSSFTQRPSLFKPFISTLTHQQPYQPHTPAYLLLQRSAIQKEFPNQRITTETLTEGSILIGKTTNYDVIYGSIPTYTSVRKNTEDDVKFRVNTSIECNVLHLLSGEKRYYLHPAVLSMTPTMDGRPRLL